MAKKRKRSKGTAEAILGSARQDSVWANPGVKLGNEAPLSCEHCGADEKRYAALAGACVYDAV